MSNSKKSSKIISLWMAMVIVLAIFVGMPVSASEARDSSIGTSNQLPAPGNPRWDGETGTATWGAVSNAGKPNEWDGITYYEWSLYRLESDRPISDASDLGDSEKIRYGGIFNKPTPSCNLLEWMNEDGYYYFTVLAFGDGTTYTDSPIAVSDAFHYVIPEDKLPTPTGLKWEWFEAEKKYFSVWDNIFGDAFIHAQGFNVTCFDESGEVYTRLFTRAELIQDRDEIASPGAMLYLDNPDGKYRFKVQAVSANANQYQSSDWSELSPWVEVKKPSPPNNGGSASSGGSSDSGSSGGSSGFGSSAATTSAPVVQTSSKIKDLATTAKAQGEIVASSSGTREVTIKGSAWSQLAGLSFQHDTLANGAVQMRVTINNPTALTKDIKVSGYVAGKDVERLNKLFDKHFSNATRVMHFDQTGSWGQEVRIAVKLDLSGMDKDNLVFYSYNKTTKKYSQIENPSYRIDANGYTHFSTPNAGDIIVSDGDLSKK